jgi:hypothetical protein
LQPFFVGGIGLGFSPAKALSRKGLKKTYFSELGVFASLREILRILVFVLFAPFAVNSPITAHRRAMPE